MTVGEFLKQRIDWSLEIDPSVPIELTVQWLTEFAKIKCDELKSELEPQLLFLSCLQNAGVDNWDGYEEAQNLYDEYLNEE